MHNTKRKRPLYKFSFALYHAKTLCWFIVGATLAASGVHIVLLPNHLIDGGIVGLSMIASHFVGQSYLPLFMFLFNLPFAFLAYKQIGKHFVIQMFLSIIAFSSALAVLEHVHVWLGLDAPISFKGTELEIMVVGGMLIGIGIGLIIRNGGSTDGTEIMAIIVNKKRGFTVGQVILFVNIFIFAAAGIVYKDWHSAFMSLLTYVIASKAMDMVIVGLEDTKTVTIISSIPRHLGQVLMENLSVGLTYLQAEGGFTGEQKQLLYIVVERLQLSQLKEIVHKEDPKAFIAIENLHEVINGQRAKHH